MNAAKSGIVAEFVTAYLQREIPIKAIVTGGTDAGLRDALVTGYAPGRLVKIVNSNGVNTIVAPTGVTSKSIGDATHIIAQSDDTVKDMPQDFNYQERYNNLPNLICKNSTEEKTVAVYKIVNVDDIKTWNDFEAACDAVLAIGKNPIHMGGANNFTDRKSVV